MNNPDRPIPISRGQEINTEKLLETLKQKLTMLENWHADIGGKIKDKEVLYNREFMKSDDKRNYGLIADLVAEIKILSEAANEIFDEMLSANDLLQEGKENLRSEQELSAMIAEMTVLEQECKEKVTPK